LDDKTFKLPYDGENIIDMIGNFSLETGNQQPLQTYLNLDLYELLQGFLYM